MPELRELAFRIAYSTPRGRTGASARRALASVAGQRRRPRRCGDQMSAETLTSGGEGQSGPVCGSGAAWATWPAYWVHNGSGMEIDDALLQVVDFTGRHD